jgi:protein-S-isoprenylcysteine O-methyltransferase Ste14
VTPAFRLAAASFVALIAALPFVPAQPAPLMRGIALVLLCLAAVFVGLPVLQLRRHGAAPDGGRFWETTAVAQRGLYAIVRHPQYLGFDFLAWGLATFALYWGTILPAMVLTFAVSRHTRAEEDRLRSRFGDVYRAYMRTVPRFGLITGLVRYLRRAAASSRARESA